MKSHFSFGLSVIPVIVTEHDIEHGVARDCQGCAIARALNRTLPRLGFKDCHVELVPYAAFTSAPGLDIIQNYPRKVVGNLPPDELPDGLLEWAMDFDEWSEFNEYGSVREWRAYTGRKAIDYDPPFRPEPISFIFNFGQLQSHPL